MPASRPPGESVHPEINRASTAFSSGSICFSFDDGSLSKRDATEAKKATKNVVLPSPWPQLSERG